MLEKEQLHSYKNISSFLKLEISPDLEYHLSVKNILFKDKDLFKSFLDKEVFYKVEFINKDVQLFTFFYNNEVIFDKKININK